MRYCMPRIAWYCSVLFCIAYHCTASYCINTLVVSEWHESILIHPQINAMTHKYQRSRERFWKCLTAFLEIFTKNCFLWRSGHVHGLTSQAVKPTNQWILKVNEGAGLDSPWQHVTHTLSLTQPRPGKTWKSALERLRLAAYHPPTAQSAAEAALKNIHPWKIFTPEKYSPLKNIHP